MRAILAVLIALLTASPAAAQIAQTPLALAQAGRWPEAQDAAARTNDPVARKLVDFLRLLTPNAASAAEIDAFMRQNPDWPLPALQERRREEALAAEPDDATVADLCTRRKPAATLASGRALLRCADALANLGRGNEAAALAREAWISKISDPATEAAFNRRFPALISAADQWARFQRLAWNDTPAAERQIALLDPGHVSMAAARLALKTGMAALGGAQVVAPAEDPGAMLDLARAYRNLDQDQAAVALWRASGAAAQNKAPDHLAAFWAERQLLARKLLRKGDAQDAFVVVAGHGQREPALVVEAEFLAGFIALRRLNDPIVAAAHFTALAAAAPAVLTQSRAWYWLGRARQAANGGGKAEFARAAAWPMTFYGQLAARAAGEPDATIAQALRAPPTPSTGLAATPITAELGHAATLLIGWGDPGRARVFLLRMDELARTAGEHIAVGDYAAAMGLPDVAVIVTRRLGKDGIMPPMQGWPAPVEPPPVLDPAVSLAIMRQESNFDVSIVSPSGARGLMQLMPATARIVAHRLGEPTSMALLTTDAAHNMRLGTEYLLEVLAKFDNSVPLAVAAYNAGPNRVAQWLIENGDPRGIDQGGISPSMIDWIEMIPFNETRNYVERVLENVVVYQARRTGTLPSIMTQWNR